MNGPYEHHIPSRAEIVAGKLADAIRRWADRREFAAFLRDCPNEAARVARDLNVGTADLLKVAGSGPPSLLNRRLRQLGIDPGMLRRAQPAVTLDMARCCSLCACKSRCARDLESRPASNGWISYCPNAHTIEAVRSHHAGAAVPL